MVDISIVGLGMVGLNQLTPEARAAMYRANTVYLLTFDEFVIAQLRNDLGDRVTDLGSLYIPGQSRDVTYVNVVHEVMSAARMHPPVCLALYGHPNMFVSPTPQIVNEATSAGLQVSVLPGISALDGLIIDLNFDPGQHGLQMFEATDVLLRKRPLDPEVPALLWQIGTIGTLVYEPDRVTKPEQLSLLVEHLLNFYPESHAITIARTKTIPIGRSRLRETTISHLPELAREVGAADTLYLPQVSQRPIMDEVLHEVLTSPAGPS